MKISKNNKSIIISNLKQNELFAFLKCQIVASVIFIDNAGNIDPSKTMILQERTIDGRKQVINVNDNKWEYKDLISDFSGKMSLGYSLNIDIDIQLFKEKESLLVILGSIKEVFVNSFVSIDYRKGIFVIENLPFKNGDSDKLYFFEADNSILGFLEDGPTIVINESINSILDVIGN